MNRSRSWRTAWLAVAFAAIAVGAPQPAKAGPTDWGRCSTARAHVSDMRLQGGMHLRLMVKGPRDAPTPPNPYARRFKVQLSGGSYPPDDPAAPSRFTVTTLAPIHSRDALRAEILAMCAPWRTTRYHAIAFGLEDPEERIAMDRIAEGRRLRLDEQSRLRSLAEFRRIDELFRRDRMRLLPTIEEVGAIVAADWGKDDFDYAPDSVFVRINDLECRPRRRGFSCMIGVIWMDGTVPHHQAKRLQLERDESGRKLRIIHEEIIVS